MIYIKNTTDAQVIFIDREVQSIDNITPITLDSNYYTKVEVNENIANSLNQAKNYTDTEVLKIDTELENINEDIDVLEGRIIDLENNGGGGSEGGDNIVYIETDENGLISEEDWLEIVNNPNNRYRIIIYQDCYEKNNKTYCQQNYVEITSINTEEYPELEDENGNKYYDCKLGGVGGFYFGTQYEWQRGFGENGYEMRLNSDTFASSNSFSSLSNRISETNDRIDVLNIRVTELEYNGGGDTTELENKVTDLDIRVTDLENKVTDLENNGGDTTELENRVDAVENRTDTLETDVDNLEVRVTNLENNGGGSSSGDTSNLLNYVYFADSGVLKKDNENGEEVDIKEWLKEFANYKGAFNNNIINIIFKPNSNYPNNVGETFRLISFVKEDLTTASNLGYYKLIGKSDTKILTIRFEYRFSVSNYTFEVTEISNGGGDTTELENRITELENRVYLFKDENYTISPTNINLAKTDLKVGKRVVLNNYFSNSETLFEVIGYDEYEKNDEWYTSISAIKGDYLYVWSTEFESVGNVIPQKIGIKYLKETITNAQAEIEANATRINNVEQVKVVDVSNGMTAEQFNTIFNNFKTINYKYLLNVGNNDLFNICSIQQANRSITAMGFDDYEGEMMCYTWFAPQQSLTPELTKRKITTEIV